MKFAMLSLAAAAALTLGAGSASAQYNGRHHGHSHGHHHGYHPWGPHLDYHRGHLHYHNGFYRSGPLYPAYPTYSYPFYNYNSGYNSGFGLNVTQPGFSLGIGNGRVTPLYNYNYGYVQPFRR